MDLHMIIVFCKLKIALSPSHMSLLQTHIFVIFRNTHMEHFRGKQIFADRSKWPNFPERKAKYKRYWTQDC
jgi:hypothetical protein